MAFCTLWRECLRKFYTSSVSRGGDWDDEIFSGKCFKMSTVFCVFVGRRWLNACGCYVVCGLGKWLVLELFLEGSMRM